MGNYLGLSSNRKIENKTRSPRPFTTWQSVGMKSKITFFKLLRDTFSVFPSLQTLQDVSSHLKLGHVERNDKSKSKFNSK